MKILKYILNHISYNKYEEKIKELRCSIDKTIYDIYINSSATFEEMKNYQNDLLEYCNGCCRITHTYYGNNARWLYYLKNKINIFKLNFDNSYILMRSNESYILANVEFNEDYIKIIKLYKTDKKDKTYIEIVKDNEHIDNFYITSTIDELFNILYK